MKLNSIELLGALNKVSGIVSDKSVVEELKSFHLYPDVEKGEVRIAGTDSMMTLINRIPYTPTDGSDDSCLVIGADKLIEIIKYAGPEVELKYADGEENEEVNIVTPRSKVVLRKHFGISDGIIDFDIEDESEFDDTLKAGVLREVFSRLSGLIDNANTDPAAKTIFFTKERAVISDDINLSVMTLETNESYEFNIKVVKMISSLLNSLDPESDVHLKKYVDDSLILVKTENDTFRFSMYDVYEPDLDLIDTFEPSASVLVSKNEFIQGLNLVKATSEEDKANITLRKSEKEGREGEVVLESFFEGENSNDVIGCPKGAFKVEGVNEIKFESLVSLIVKLANVIDSEGIVVAIDVESSVLFIREPKKKIVSAISVRLEN